MPKPVVEEHGYQRGPFVALEIEATEVAQWSPEVEPGSQPTQVHLMFHVKGLPYPMALRFKGPGTLTALIEQLTQHRDEVWPPAARGGG